MLLLLLLLVPLLFISFRHVCGGTRVLLLARVMVLECITSLLKKLHAIGGPILPV